MQRNLWGEPVERTAEYFVFHDESEPNKRWLLIGLLLVRKQDLDGVRAVLQNCRRNEGYDGELHFSRLPKSFGGAWGAKACVAREWLRAFQNGLSDRVFFSALAVDRQSPRYDHKRFTKEFHAYNRFTAMALKAAIAWHLGPQKLDAVTVHFISDAKDRATRPDRDWTDNFESYLPYRAELDSFLSESATYPLVKMDLELRASAQEDLLQLCDLLLGATQMALVAGSSRPTKRELGEIVVRWCRDLQQPPWKQQFGLYRKFNLWGFPDQNGGPYNRVELSLRIEDGQLGLF
ncbi:MAG TPA: hypothetical protein VNL18_02030 [Gemmatimonadales bacterium]|nr:hypothetical protein [Gemmatimonadales bacterium]